MFILKHLLQVLVPLFLRCGNDINIVMMVRGEKMSLVHGMWGVFAAWPETGWATKLATCEWSNWYVWLWGNGFGWADVQRQGSVGSRLAMTMNRQAEVVAWFTTFDYSDEEGGCIMGGFMWYVGWEREGVRDADVWRRSYNLVVEVRNKCMGSKTDVGTQKQLMGVIDVSVYVVRLKTVDSSWKHIKSRGKSWKCKNGWEEGCGRCMSSKTVKSEYGGVDSSRECVQTCYKGLKMKKNG